MLLTTLWLMAFGFKWKCLASPDYLAPAPGRVCARSRRVRLTVSTDPSKYLTCSPLNQDKNIWKKRSCKPTEMFVAKKQRCQPRSMVKRQESLCRTQPDSPVCLQAQQNAQCQSAQQPGFQVAPGAPCDWVSAPLEPYTASPNYFLQCNPSSMNNVCGSWNQMQCSNGTVFSMFVQICITVAISQASCPAGEIGMFPCGQNSWCPSGATCRDGVCCQSGSVGPEALSTQAPPTLYPQQLTTDVQTGSMTSQRPEFPGVYPPVQPQPGQPGGFPQPGQPAFPQPGQTWFPQPGQPGVPEPGQQMLLPRPGQPGYPQPGQPGYPQPGQQGFPQPGQPGFPQPGQPGFPQPGQPGFPQPGQQGFPQPGQPGYVQPGQPGFQQPQPGQQISPQTGQLGYLQPYPQPGQQLPSQPGQPLYPQPPSPPGQPIYPQQPYPGQSVFPQQPQPPQPGQPQPGQPVYPTPYPPYMTGRPGFPAQPQVFPQPPAPPGYPQPQPAFPPPLSYPYPQPGVPPQQPQQPVQPPNVLQPPPGQQPGQQPSWSGYPPWPQQPIPPAPGYPQPFTQAPITLYPPVVPMSSSRGVDYGFFTTPRNLPSCPDNQLANTFCKDNYDCPENQFCFSGGCCHLGRCPSGVTPVNHCHDLHDCLPNQYCYNSGCCPVQSCPNGEAPTRSCDEKNPCPSSLTCQSGGCCSSSLPDCPNGDSASMPCSGSGTCPSGQFCHTDKSGYKRGCCDIPRCPNGTPALQPCGPDNSCPVGLLCLNNACCASPATGAYQTYGATTAIYPALPYTVGPFVPPPTLSPGMLIPSPVMPTPPRACRNCCPTLQVAICFCATLNVCPQMTTCSNRGACCAARDALPFYSAKRPGDRCYADTECPGFDAGTSRCSNGYCICVPGAVSNGFSCVRMPPTQYSRYGKRKHPGTKKDIILTPVRRARDLSRLENYDNEISQRKLSSTSNSSHSAENEDDFDQLVVAEEQLIYWRTFEQNHCVTDNECIPEMICVAGKCREIIYSLNQPNCDHDDQCNRSIPHSFCAPALDNTVYSNSSSTINRVCRCHGDYYEHHQQCLTDCPDGTTKMDFKCVKRTDQSEILPRSSENNSTAKENTSLAAVS